MVLVVDDILDEGVSLRKILPYLEGVLKTMYTDAHFATYVCWYKTCSKIKPNYFGLKIEPDENGVFPWIITSWESSAMRADARLRGTPLHDVLWEI